jgi:hypothetical protein
MMNQGDLEIRPARAENATAITESVAAAHRRYIAHGKPPGPTLHGYKEVIERHGVLVLTGQDQADAWRIARNFGITQKGLVAR